MKLSKTRRRLTAIMLRRLISTLMRVATDLYYVSTISAP